MTQIIINEAVTVQDVFYYLCFRLRDDDEGGDGVGRDGRGVGGGVVCGGGRNGDRGGGRDSGGGGGGGGGGVQDAAAGDSSPPGNNNRPGKVVLVYPELRPGLPILRRVYAQVHDVLFSGDGDGDGDDDGGAGGDGDGDGDGDGRGVGGSKVGSRSRNMRRVTSGGGVSGGAGGGRRDNGGDDDGVFFWDWGSGGTVYSQTYLLVLRGYGLD